MAFIPGIELSRRFYWEVARPFLDEHYPGLPHAAAHIGPGSDVLGFDTQMSTERCLAVFVSLGLDSHWAGGAPDAAHWLCRG